jgi:hypothetical protein
MPAITLKLKLIHALEAIYTHPDSNPQQLKILVNRLKNKDIIIPENDYEKVFEFIELILQHRPDLMKNPNNRALQDLCQECLSEFNFRAEPPTKSPQSHR